MMFRHWITALVGALLSACQTVSLDDMAPTYEKGFFHVGKNAMKQLDLAAQPDDLRPLQKRKAALRASKSKFPVIVFLHGCGGFTTGTSDTLSKVENAAPDFITIAPNSFARKRPQVCGGYTATDLYATSVYWRELEAEYALRELSKEPWVDWNNVFLVGHSQGGGTALGLKTKHKIRGRVSLSGGCYSGATTRTVSGNATDQSFAVLAFHQTRDKWFYGKSYEPPYGTACPTLAKRHPNGKVVFTEGDNHHAFTYPKNIEIFRGWLYSNLMRGS